jgi:hypothetical protein
MWPTFEDSLRVCLEDGEATHAPPAADPQFELGIRLLDEDRLMPGICTQLMARQAQSRTVVAIPSGTQSLLQALELPSRTSS